VSDDWHMLVSGALDCHCKDAEEGLESLVQLRDGNQMAAFDIMF
jgi:hypothetical protein